MIFFRSSIGYFFFLTCLRYCCCYRESFPSHLLSISCSQSSLEGGITSMLSLIGFFLFFVLAGRNFFIDTIGYLYRRVRTPLTTFFLVVASTSFSLISSTSLVSLFPPSFSGYCSSFSYSYSYSYSYSSSSSSSSSTATSTYSFLSCFILNCCWLKNAPSRIWVLAPSLEKSYTSKDSPLLPIGTPIFCCNCYYICYKGATLQR